MSVLSADDFPWKRSRFGFAVFFHFSLLVACSALRLVLFFQFGSPDKFSFGNLIQALLIGFHRDWLVALIVTLPLLLWLGIVPDRAYGKPWHRVVLIGGSLLFWTAQFVFHVAEYFFFAEYHSRFDTVAADNLHYPLELFASISASVPLTTVLLASGAAATAWLIAALIYFRQMWFQPTTVRLRFGHLVVGLVLTSLVYLTVSPEVTHFVSNRTLNEIADNGCLAVAASVRARNPDYRASYLTLPREEAFARARKLLKQPRTEFVGDTNSLRRRVAGDAARPRLNVVILLEESLGSEFWGCLGRKASLTPAMDKLAQEEGLLFTNIFACGNRPTHGFEGVYASFPPLPGDPLVRRDRSENLETLARLLQRDGYGTLFVHGGRDRFEGIGTFARNNGWDRYLGQPDFPEAKFVTIQGVCDEEVFDRALGEFRRLAETGQPFFGTVLSVTTRKPFTYPAGRIPEDPDARLREHAVRYSDWCLGQFFARAKKESFWTNTIFVVTANHGASGPAQPNTVRACEIPLVILGPAAVKEPRRIGTPGGLLDIPPTVLGLIGRPHETLFFGRDLLNDPPERARIVIRHQHDFSLFARDRLVVLGPRRTAWLYEGTLNAGPMKPATKPDEEFVELEKDAMAIFQVANELYLNRQYRLDDRPASSPAAPAATNNPAPGGNAPAPPP